MAQGLDSALGKAEIAPVGWTRRRARRRIAPEGRSALLVVLDDPSGDGTQRARSVADT
jgi:hypothetical protein